MSIRVTQIWLEARAFDLRFPVFSDWFRDVARTEEMMVSRMGE